MSSGRLAIIVLVLAAAGGAFIWWPRKPPPPPPSPPPVARPVAPAALEPMAPPEKPAIQHPVDPDKEASSGLPTLDESDEYLKNALGKLLGQKPVRSFLNLDGFARRFVATVNNLGTDNAAAELWPVKPTAGTFAAETRGGGSVISGKNADRYALFVRFVDGVDARRAVALYVRAYPLLQRAYEDLGFPGKYFNDRVVEVIDHLLATPDLPEPIRVKPVLVPGTNRPVGWGGLYVFEDPALEAGSSGQKIMLRVGRVNAAKLKAKLTEVRQLLVKRAVARSPQ